MCEGVCVRCVCVRCVCASLLLCVTQLNMKGEDMGCKSRKVTITQSLLS